ncbi:MAG TPA: transposase [Gemmataceae bacterium]|nr:transposase [Gemmataceae bacterium]
MPDEPLAYFVTFTCYGTWLHGDERGSVDLPHNQYGTDFLPSDQETREQIRSAMRDPPYFLDEVRRTIVLRAILELVKTKRWQLFAIHVRSNHVHIVVKATQLIERVMNDCKSIASRDLNLAFPEERDRKRWTRRGSTRYLWTNEQLEQKIDYVLNQQGAPMARYPEQAESSNSPSEPRTK